MEPDMAVIGGKESWAKRLIFNAVVMLVEPLPAMLRLNFEHPKVLTVEVTVGQWGVPFWYRQGRDAGNIACNWPWAL